ncbi:MAG TPA: (2Fe-2S)-binding protein [Intrasporangium sp.]|nr:(2Fe-2S)-binding protein [Intrasporangium sp.]
MAPRPDAAAVLHLVDRSVGWVDVGLERRPGDVACGELVRAARAGGDPLKRWRDALRDQLASEGGTVPRHLPAAFVLQWWCQVAAVPLAYAASLGPWVLRPRPDDVAFDLAPGLYPGRIVLDPQTPVDVVDDVAARLAAGRTAYGMLVDDVTRGFAPDVRMGSRQRWGVVEDTWRAALHGAARVPGALTGPAAGGPPRRVSCCFLYLLPGRHECATCPRGANPRGGR